MIVDGNIKTVISANANTIAKFQSMREMLMEFLSSSPNMERYIDSVLEIKNQETKDDQYPIN